MTIREVVPSCVRLHTNLTPDSSSACLICFDPLRPGSLRIEHWATATKVDTFCLSCIRGWAREPNGGVCPGCAHPIINRITYMPKKGRSLREPKRSEEWGRLANLGNVDGMLLVSRSGPVRAEMEWLLAACQRGDQAVLSALRQGDPRFSLVLLNPNEIQAFFADGGTISEEALGIAVRWAAELGHIDALQTLLATGRPFSEEDFGLAVRLVAESGRADGLQALFATGRAISVKDLGMAVRWAAHNGHVAALQMLLASGRPFSEEDFGHAVRVAAKGDYLDVLRALLASGRVISREDFGEAVKLAAESGHADALQELFASGGALSEEDLGGATKLAVGNGHPEIFRALLVGRPMTTVRRLFPLTIGLPIATDLTCFIAHSIDSDAPLRFIADYCPNASTAFKVTAVLLATSIGIVLLESIARINRWRLLHREY